MNITQGTQNVHKLLSTSQSTGGGPTEGGSVNVRGFRQCCKDLAPSRHRQVYLEHFPQHAVRRIANAP